VVVASNFCNASGVASLIASEEDGKANGIDKLDGMWVFGFLIGSLTIIIRLFGGLPEGIMYAILLANASVPLIEAVTQPGKFGQPGKRDKQ